MITVIRHGQALCNVDETLFATTPDHSFSLTDLGKDQVRNAGKQIKECLRQETETLQYYISPYTRTKETAAILREVMPPLFPDIEDPRLRERSMGQLVSSHDVPHIMETRRQFGKFFYHFDRGESGLTVFDRASSFIDHLLSEPNDTDNRIIVTHSYTMRIILMYMFNLSVDNFELLNDPDNADWIILNKYIFDLARTESFEELKANTDFASYQVFRD